MSVTPTAAPIQLDAISIRLTESTAEIEAAQRLRYKVFYEEYAATPDKETAASRLDADDYDDYADHLIVIDDSRPNEKIVGTYRLLRREPAMRYGQFYSSDEFDITNLKNSELELLELGRSCVLPEYRTKPILNLLWQGIADYVTDHKIDVMFGCASLQGTDIPSIATPLSYLHHFHQAPEHLCPRAIKGRYINMNLIPKDDLHPRRAFASLPPLIKGYLRIGGSIGDGAVIDKQFGSTDVCIVVETHKVTQKYRSHYERKLQKTMHSGKESEGADAADTAGNVTNLKDFKKDKDE